MAIFLHWPPVAADGLTLEEFLWWHGHIERWVKRLNDGG